MQGQLNESREATMIPFNSCQKGVMQGMIAADVSKRPGERVLRRDFRPKK
jgi:hypothetical protein